MAAFFRFVFVAVTLGVLGAYGFLRPSMSKHITHGARAIVDGVEFHAYQPLSFFETFGKGIDHLLSKREGSGSTKESASKFIESRLGISTDTFRFSSGFDGQVTNHAYFQQVFNGIPVANAVANVALNKQNKVTAFGHSFVNTSNINSPIPSITAEQAAVIAEKALSATRVDRTIELEYFAKDDNSVVLTHVVQVRNNDHWFEAFVDAKAGSIVGLHDFIVKLSYRVIPIMNQDLSTGFFLLVNPEDPIASPIGWVTSNTTAGNNAITVPTCTVTSPGTFDYPYNTTTAPTTSNNKCAGAVNAFYTVNTVHDITYRYGFTEPAFNFQNDNFGKGGLGNDRIIIFIQDSSGVDNADFSTPPDGQSGTMRMFLWDFTNPERDGAIENDIVVHEATHGTSNRLTGGGTARCLQTTEAGGMGEGWSDAFADWTEQKSAPIQDFVLGAYVINDPAGIRTFPYSTSSIVNPLTYGDLQTRTDVHDIGEVWANMLHNVHAALVTAHGFSSTARTDPTTTGGNTVFMHLFIDQLAIQPCNPTFPGARDAWIQADATQFGGANFCILWNAFASRGLGVNAANHINDFSVPAGC